MVCRTIGYRNSWLPHLFGKVAASGSGSRLDVTMTYHPAVAVFTVLWLVGLGSVGVRQALSGHFTRPGGGTWIEFVMFVFGLVVPLAAFGFEVDPSRRAFEAAVHGQG